MNRYPPLQVVNEADEPVGEAMLEEILDKSLLHRVVHVLVEDNEGKLLLQLRGPNVRTNPGTWDFSAAGYVDPGENYEQAAVREVSEELGLNGLGLMPMGVLREAEVINGRTVNRLAGTFRVTVPSETRFNIQKEEVARVKWFSRNELKRLISDSSNKVTFYFAQWVRDNYLK